tara:strand:+ start:9642 stop:10616 length:975 start_codon:yes stop_codon:yes gene_type:complete
LAQVLRQLNIPENPNLIVGSATGDDAAVYKMSESQALVVTVDFFPPIVDDPWFYGAISAANSISDIYAMGGKPFLALNIACFPSDLPIEILSEIQKGGQEKAAEAGVIIVGGHTINDEEPKYGMAVIGSLEPGKEVTKSGSKVGDKLILTKPIGTGLITTGGKQNVVNKLTMDKALESMSLLNKDASEAMMDVGVNSCTDITGFGLLGHMKDMMTSSGVTANIYSSKVPILDGSLELAKSNIFPDGTNRNIDYVADLVSWDPSLEDHMKLILCDPQTSGGLLISVDESKLELLIGQLGKSGNNISSVIGDVVDLEGQFHINILP